MGRMPHGWRDKSARKSICWSRSPSIPQPPVAAMRILAREAFMEKFGEDPRKWEEKILEAAKPKLFAEFKNNWNSNPSGKTCRLCRRRGSPEAGRAKEQRIADVLYGGD